jgi:hypothetical protein
MRPITLIFIGLALALASETGLAQYRSSYQGQGTSEYLRTSSSSIGLSSLRGLLDPSRMHMSHSVSFATVMSGGKSASEGLYVNRLDYQLSSKLWATTQLGYRYRPGSASEWNPAGDSGDFVGGMDLNWSPTTNSNFRLSISRGLNSYDTGLFSYGPYGYGYFPGRP